MQCSFKLLRASTELLGLVGVGTCKACLYMQVQLQGHVLGGVGLFCGFTQLLCKRRMPQLYL